MSCPFLGSRLGQGGIRKQVLQAAGPMLAPDPLVSSAMPALSALRKVCRARGLVKLRTYWSRTAGYNQYYVAKRLKVDMQVLQRFWQTFGVCWLAVMPMLGPIDP